MEFFEIVGRFGPTKVNGLDFDDAFKIDLTDFGVFGADFGVLCAECDVVLLLRGVAVLACVEARRVGRGRSINKAC